LLLDEPLAGLDAPLRAAMRSLFVNVHRRYGMTVLLVTHDQADALALGERVAVLVDGQLLQLAPPMEVYDRPARVEVGRFIGEPAMNLIPATLVRTPGGVRLAWLGRVEDLPGIDPDRWLPDGLPERPLILGVRPERITVAEDTSEAVPAFPATIRRVERLGPSTIVELEVHARSLRHRGDGRTSAGVGSVVSIRIDPEAAIWFDPSTGQRIEADPARESQG
jgi:ABC-type sugar transport system ATPase subunit